MSERILFWITIAGFALALVGVGVAFAVSNHPDRVKAAKLFFFLAALVFAVGICYWTISTGQKLAMRIVADLISMSLIAAGLFGGFRFADRGLLTDLKIPSSAFVREPLWPQNKNFAAGTSIGILALTALLNVSREPDPIGTLFWPLTVVLYNLYGFPLRLFVMVGINVLALIVIYRQSLRRQTRLECAEPRLHSLADQDKDRIKSLVRIPWIAYRPHFDKKEPDIDFVFTVFNNSLYDIVIDNKIKKGDIWCDSSDDPFYYEPKIQVFRPTIVCASRAGTNFVIRHLLTVEEVSRFKGKDNVIIGFGNLEITFAGTEQFPGILPTRLETNHYLETKKGEWYNPNQQEEFAFLYTDEQWALLAKSTPQEVVKLRAESDSLKSQLLEYTGDEPKRLRAIAERDRGNLPSAILVYHCEIQYELYESVPHIDFRFELFNGSVYEVSVLDSIPEGSYVKFRKQRLMGKTAIIRNEATNVAHASRELFWLRLQLSREEADLIGHATNPSIDYFYFDKLQVQIVCAGIEAQPLTLPHAIPSSIGHDSKLREQVESLRSELNLLRTPKLTFEIDGKSTQVKMGGGAAVLRINAEVKLRCLKVSEGKMAVREFRAALYKQTRAGEEMVGGSVGANRAWLLSKVKNDTNLDIADGLILSEPISPYYWFFFSIECSPAEDALLSRDYFVRVTMNTLEPEAQSIDFYIESWSEARKSNSSIILRQTS